MGRVFQPQYWKNMPDGSRAKVKTKAWYAEWQVAGETKRKKIGPRAIANAALAKFEDSEARRRAGLPDLNAEARLLAAPLADLATEYLEVLAARDTCDEYRKTTSAQITRMLSECRWRVWTDIEPNGFVRFLGRLRDTPRVKKATGAAKGKRAPRATDKVLADGCGPATLNSYMRAAKAFARWLADRFHTTSPLRTLKPYPEAVDVRRSNRILTDDELGKLLIATGAATRKGTATVWGKDRAMLYRIAAYSGLRAGELSVLTPLHFTLDAEPPVITVQAADAKNKRTEPIPLPQHVVELLRPWLAGRGPKEKLFPGNWAQCRKQCQWLAADLKRAGVDATNDKGQPVTFHSLKRRFVVRLIQAGAKIHEVRRMARHADISTTLKHYAEDNLKELGALANRLALV
ncbi:integrase-recombinase protein : Integrase-recombinase protein OS=Rhodopirellula sallentina SM41 GN=RSSM_04495 PE=4 SV=1: Phage_integrase [Gemmata massiliana]|uniref:Tyr recombinase domain-containing protein n=1 Tax=Gemmata massiliana TaxID=1210884 RepID=A0A6P2D0M4_9BACT|nr:tyrosine-type recombinase/integrase [Gemmata massiliana]VTR94136.1 integrase-recombinase protein : Integrase-recombinase protein OS=Rhodopirellula sallentina SM41 GN=RSSM_04495 PE=4 SV=1: Phage_integrase [Gemmata massiliana]